MYSLVLTYRKTTGVQLVYIVTRYSVGRYKVILDPTIVQYKLKIQDDTTQLWCRNFNLGTQLGRNRLATLTELKHPVAVQTEKYLIVNGLFRIYGHIFNPLTTRVTRILQSLYYYDDDVSIDSVHVADNYYCDTNRDHNMPS